MTPGLRFGNRFPAMWESDKLTALTCHEANYHSRNLYPPCTQLLLRRRRVESGKRLYQGLCVGCHGEDGSGGGHGPSFLDVRRPRATSQEAVRNLILKGIPDGGMPAFKMPDEQADAIAAYVMTSEEAGRRRPAAGAAAPGDAAAGERFFAGKGNCASCHMVRGRGGVLGPDLSNVGRDRRPAQIEQALRDPGSGARRSGGPRRTRRTRSGSNLSGGDGAAARRPDAAGHREEREHVRPATAGRRWQAAPAVEGPGRGDRPREIADAEGRGDARRKCATWSPTSAACRPIRMPRRCSRRANSGRAFRSPTWRIPSRAPGPLTTAT